MKISAWPPAREVAADHLEVAGRLLGDHALERHGGRRRPGRVERRGAAGLVDQQLHARARRIRRSCVGPVSTGRSSVPLSTAE